MTETEKYVRRYLKEDLANVQASPISHMRNGLTVFEKTLIYHYTASGYLTINTTLRRSKGRQNTKAGMLLNAVLEKLPDWRGLAYRNAYLTNQDIQRYRAGMDSGSCVLECSFVSCSRSPGKARNYPHANTEYQILSKHGKSVEDYSCLGSHHPPNEEEILFQPRTSFQVLDVNDSGPMLLIIMKEL